MATLFIFHHKRCHYEHNWSKHEENDPKISGIPNNTDFNRNEGWKVLYIVKSLTDHLAYKVESFGNKMEEFVHNRLPVEIRTQKDTIKWIKDNWKNFAVE